MREHLNEVDQQNRHGFCSEPESTTKKVPPPLPALVQMSERRELSGGHQPLRTPEAYPIVSHLQNIWVMNVKRRENGHHKK